MSTPLVNALMMVVGSSTPFFTPLSLHSSYTGLLLSTVPVPYDSSGNTYGGTTSIYSPLPGDATYGIYQSDSWKRIDISPYGPIGVASYNTMLGYPGLRYFANIIGDYNSMSPLIQGFGFSPDTTLYPTYNNVRAMQLYTGMDTRSNVSLIFGLRRFNQIDPNLNGYNNLVTDPAMYTNGGLSGGAIGVNPQGEVVIAYGSGTGRQMVGAITLPNYNINETCWLALSLTYNPPMLIAPPIGATAGSYSGTAYAISKSGQILSQQPVSWSGAVPGQPPTFSIYGNMSFGCPYFDPMDFMQIPHLSTCFYNQIVPSTLTSDQILSVVNSVREKIQQINPVAGQILT